MGGYAGCGFYSIVADPENYGVVIPNTLNNPAYKSAQFRSFIDFFYNFLEYVKKNRAPLDFFSWHTYAPIEHNLTMQQFTEKTLEKYGYGNVEIHLNEWNTAYEIEDRGTSYSSARAAAMMCAMHRTKMTVMCYYDARIGPSGYGGLFDPNTHKPVSTYYAFKAFGELYALGNCVESECESVYSLAAISDDGSKKAVLLANLGEAVTIKTDLEGMKAYLVEKDVFLEEIQVDLANIEIGENQVILLKNY